MAYEARIKLVQEIMRKIDRDLKVAANEEDRAKLMERRSQVFEELRRLKRLEWEERNERIDMSEDR